MNTPLSFLVGVVVGFVALEPVRSETLSLDLLFGGTSVAVKQSESPNAEYAHYSADGTLLDTQSPAASIRDLAFDATSGDLYALTATGAVFGDPSSVQRFMLNDAGGVADQSTYSVGNAISPTSNLTVHGGLVALIRNTAPSSDAVLYSNDGSFLSVPFTAPTIKDVSFDAATGDLYALTAVGPFNGDATSIQRFSLDDAGVVVDQSSFSVGDAIINPRSNLAVHGGLVALIRNESPNSEVALYSTDGSFIGIPLTAPIVKDIAFDAATGDLYVLTGVGQGFGDPTSVQRLTLDDNGGILDQSAFSVGNAINPVANLAVYTQVVPEPSSITLACITAICLAFRHCWRWKTKAC